MIRSLATLALLASGLVAVACATAPGDTGAQPSFEADALVITARDLRFSTQELAALAGEPFTIVFENQEAAPHNVAVYLDASALEAILVEEPFSGPRTVTYVLPALEPGDYFFRCDLHPDMQGVLRVA